MATTQEQKSVEELGAEVSSSGPDPAALPRAQRRRVEGPPRRRLGRAHVDLRRALRPRPPRRRAPCATSSASRPATASRCCCPTSRRCSSCTTPCPASAAVLVPLNTRLASPEYDYILEHCGAKVLVAYRPLQKALDPALEELGDDAPRVVWVEEGDADSDYEQLLADADPIDLERPEDERDADLDQLHLGHHRPPQGRDDQPPRRLPARARRDRRGPPDAAQQLPVDAADVPLQRLGLPVGGHRDGRQARLPAEGRGEADLEGADRGGRDPPVRRADRADHDRRRRRGRAARDRGVRLRRRRAAVADAARAVPRS